MNRLFFFLQQRGINVRKVIPIKPHIYVVETNNDKYVLKGYATFEKMWLQFMISKQLQKTGFTSTSFARLLPNGKTYEQFESTYWLVFDYLPYDEPFSFRLKEDRKQSLETLHLYHTCSHMLPEEFCSILPVQSIWSKWHKRVKTIDSYKQVLSFYMGESIVRMVLDWSSFALARLAQAEISESFHTCLHGDITEHNYVKADKVYLIDFDCMSYGPILYDYVKWCHIALSYENWSLEELTTFYELKELLSNRMFLLFLIFPEDLIREWYYFLFLSDNEKKQFEQQLIYFTKKQFRFRLQFVERLYNMVT